MIIDGGLENHLGCSVKIVDFNPGYNHYQCYQEYTEWSNGGDETLKQYKDGQHFSKKNFFNFVDAPCSIVKDLIDNWDYYRENFEDSFNSKNFEIA